MQEVAISAIEIDDLQGRRVGLVTKCAAMFIDFVVVLVGYPALLWGWAIIVALLDFSVPHYPDTSGTVGVVVTAAWQILYFLIGWHAAGRTVGMAVMGIRVVSRHHEKINLFQAVVRLVVMNFTFPIIPIWLFFAPSRLALHDRASRTQVIYDAMSRRTRVKIDVDVPAGT